MYICKILNVKYINLISIFYYNMQKLDNSWKSWIQTNLARGCNSTELAFEIMLRVRIYS